MTYGFNDYVEDLPDNFSENQPDDFSQNQSDIDINNIFNNINNFLKLFVGDENYINKISNKKRNKKILTNDNIKINHSQYDKNTIDKYLSFEINYKEIPSRSLILSNIPEDTTEDDFKFLLTRFGDYQEIDMKTIKEGKVIVRFYDLRDAMMMRTSKITIKTQKTIMSFGNDLKVIDKKNPPNNGTIVVFNLPEKVKEEDIYSKFKEFGDIKDIRRTPNKNTQRFIEYYDSRSAFKAKKSMKKKKLTITGKYCHINVEFSLPGNYRINHEKYYINNVPTIQKRKITITN